MSEPLETIDDEQVDEQEPVEEYEQPEPDEEPGELPAGWAYNERAFFAGMTQSGKSELINHFFSTVRCQRILIDTKHEFTIAGVQPVTTPEAIDWTQPVVHYQDSTGDPDEFDAVFTDAFYREGPRVVAVHELGDLCKFQPSRTPAAVIAYLNKGQGLGKGFLGGSQRPVMIPVHARTEASHVYMMVPALGPDDHDALAKTIGRSSYELRCELDELQHEHGKYAFLWWPRGTRELIPSPPLPPELCRQSIVGRITPP